MKKLITGAIAAMALLFGFAACSGEFSSDLHKNETRPLTVTGLCGTEVVPMTIPEGGDGSEQYLTFVYAKDTVIKGLDGQDKALKDGWGGIANPQLKIIPQTALNEDRQPNWSMDYAGPHDKPIYVKAGEDWLELDYRGKDGNTNPGNIFLDGLILNEEYTLSVKFDAASNRVDFKVLGSSSDPSAITFVLPEDSDFKNFPLKDKKGNGLNYSMEKAGKEYTYDFISVADEEVVFSLKNDLTGTFGGTLSTTESDLELNADSIKNFKLSVKKNVEYKITVDISKGINKSTIKYEVVSMLKKATLNADWKYSGIFYEIKYESPFYFQAENIDLSIAVRRAEDCADNVWGKGTSSISVNGEEVELAYSTTNETPAKVDGLVKGDWYLITLTENNDVFTLKAKVVSAPMPNLTEFSSYLWSNVNDSAWHEDTGKYPNKHGFPKFEKDSSVENTYYCDFSPVDTTVDFGIKKMNDAVEDTSEGNDHGSWFGCGAEINELETEAEGNITKGNSKIVNLEAGGNYRLYVTFVNPVTVNMKVIKK